MRTAIIVALLLSTFALAGVLAREAFRAQEEHRETAAAILGDYASFAANQIAQRSYRSLRYYSDLTRNQVSDPARKAFLGDGPAEKDRVLSDINPNLRRSLNFLFALKGDRFDVVGAEPGAEDLKWVREAVARGVEGEEDPGRTVSLLFPPPERRGAGLVGYWTESGSAEVVLGFSLDADTVQTLLERVIRQGPLLPASLTRGTLYDSLVAFTVIDPHGGVWDGQEWERGGAAAPLYGRFIGRDSVVSWLGGLQVEVSLAPELAAVVAPEGLSPAQAPVIAGLLLLTGAVVGAALLLLRREYELTRLRSNFVSNVSHELRTPLAQIRMFAETLSLGRVRSKGEENRSLAIIDQEARRLTHLVENLLQFSRSERGVSRISVEQLDLGPVLWEIVEGFEPLAAARQVELQMSVPEGLEVSADRGALSQMVLNLLENAVKYGPEGQTVNLSATPVKGAVRISVDDEGPGVPPKDRDRIWRRFWRRKAGRESEVTGTGIGLAVVRELAELHGGRTWVEDGKRGGASFVVELPAEDSPDGEARPEEHGRSDVRDGRVEVLT